MADPPYQRLTRERYSSQFALVAAARQSLWLGDDHLLLVTQTGFTESYKRFYFRDIQAIIVRETPRREVWNAILGVPLALCLIGLIASAIRPANWTAFIVWSTLAAVFLAPFLLNNFRGRACACQLRTAVQTEEIASLRRLRLTRSVLDRIRPLIVAAQGRLTPDEVSARLQAEASVITPPPAPATPASPLPPVIS